MLKTFAASLMSNRCLEELRVLEESERSALVLRKRKHSWVFFETLVHYGRDWMAKLTSKVIMDAVDRDTEPYIRNAILHCSSHRRFAVLTISS